MRYLILSDIHGGSRELQQALGFFKEFRADVLVLLGDLLNHGPRNQVPNTYDPPSVADQLNALKDRIVSIRGNCDSEVDSMVFSFPCNAAYGYLLIETKTHLQRIFLTHGHLHPVNTPEQAEKLGLKAPDLVLSGHTHVSGIFEKASGIININPGSITIPKGGTEPGFALVTESAVELYNLSGRRLDAYVFA